MCENTFWTRNVSQLWCDWNLIPSQDEGIYSQLNTLTRLAIVIALVVLVVRKSPQEAAIFLLAGVGSMALLSLIVNVDQIPPPQKV
jgi:hypothetical protein